MTLEWFTVDDEGDEHDSTLTLECELLIDDVRRHYCACLKTWRSLSAMRQHTRES